MKMRFALAFAMVICSAFTVSAQKTKYIPNPSIDMKAFLKMAAMAADHRETRRLTEDEFLGMSKEPGVIILDARSRQKYDELHIRGAVNLSFPDITVESLERMFPDKNARILIYCNNNFRNAEDAFPRKSAPHRSIFPHTFRSILTVTETSTSSVRCSMPKRQSLN